MVVIWFLSLFVFYISYGMWSHVELPIIYWYEFSGALCLLAAVFIDLQLKGRSLKAPDLTALMIVLIILCVRLLEIAFFPAAVGLMQLETEGSSTELEKQISGGMNRTYAWVIAIYILVAHSAWLGVSHPGS